MQVFWLVAILICASKTWNPIQGSSIVSTCSLYASFNPLQVIAYFYFTVIYEPPQPIGEGNRLAMHVTFKNAGSKPVRG